MILEFSYIEARGVEPSPCAPDVPTFRPTIPVRIGPPEGEASLFYALVDTGADETMMPLILARPLGVRLGSKVYSLRSGGNEPILVQYGMVELTIGQDEKSYRWRAKIGFQKDRRSVVLGRAGCLDLLQVGFDGPGRRVIITTPD